MADAKSSNGGDIYRGTEETKVKVRLEVEGLETTGEPVVVEDTTNAIITAFADSADQQPGGISPRVVTFGDPGTLAALLGGIYRTILGQYGPEDAITLFNLAAAYIPAEESEAMAQSLARSLMSINTNPIFN